MCVMRFRKIRERERERERCRKIIRATRGGDGESYWEYRERRKRRRGYWLSLVWKVTEQVEQQKHDNVYVPSV